MAIELDLRGLKCPLPVLHTRKALQAADPGTRIVVSCTDPMAAIDIPHLLQQRGDRLVSQERRDNVLVFTIERATST
ncbi:sulfurtransferase TusA family protein [Chelatococcus asaccharovorans]|uniref:tRNA 2-thiouridine synthesizing protein A n=1 Tax=Chelatococcus asaccharovorans TaxID=28210 RepID=A0A2V3U424_9HYPH|nr:sulfurtransferase TusA family protein [Chelatococcus asaccharovorans]MBS7702745.1 sulfurtransferase TusA family protein [Chelatococcus asaccharovorans]PXW57038.1 tRNA 2-thiouridine synthesizing protein A [Chelatococcus asaccharovorans]CAH1672482.1 tRNA 2-thiouridine synthesizing protein A [Chelatococcus asaccharovorans]CAH1676114.1 tRNA 2-thiouridine synthesizing protein A [Chelatococcus asaccharovorans]